jgi:hypothetical protein
LNHRNARCNNKSIPSTFRTHLHLHVAWELSPKQRSFENRPALDRKAISLQTSKSTSYSPSACLHRLSSLMPEVSDPPSFVSPSCSPCTFTISRDLYPPAYLLYFSGPSVSSNTHPSLQPYYLSKVFLCIRLFVCPQPHTFHFRRLSCLSPRVRISLQKLQPI